MNMELNGGRDDHETKDVKTTSDLPHPQPHRAKSYDETSRLEGQAGIPTSRHHVYSRSLKGTPGAQVENDLNIQDPLRPASIFSWHLDRGLRQNDGDIATSEVSLLGMPNGKSEMVPGEHAVQTDYGSNHPEYATINGRGNASTSEEFARPAPNLSSPSRSHSPPPFRSHPADGEDYGLFLNNDQAEAPELLPIDERQGIRPSLLETDAGDRTLAPVQQSSTQNVQNLVEGDTFLSEQPDTMLPDPLPLPEQLETYQAQQDAERFGKQLRHLGRRIHNVQLKRVQWQHEYQGLESCRRYLRESTTELMSALDIQQPVEASQSSPMTKRKKKRKPKQETTAVVGGQSSDQTSKVDSSISTAEGAGDVDGFEPETEPTSISPLNPFEASSKSNSLSRHIYELFERYLDDFEKLTKQEEVEKKLMKDLSSREFHLDSLRQSIEISMKSPGFVGQLQAEMLDVDLNSTDASSRTASEEELPPLIAQYFDHHGNIGIYLERLQELDYGHQEGLQERYFLRDRGDELNVSDTDFEYGFRNQRDQIESDLDNARDQLAKVAERCKAAGLDPEKYRNVAPSPHSMSPVPSGKVVQKDLLPVKQASSQAPRVGLSPTIRGQSSLQIEGWLQQVPGPSSHQDITESEDGFLAPPEIPALDLPDPYSPEMIEQKPFAISLVSFEWKSFDVETFGFPRSREVEESVY